MSSETQAVDTGLHRSAPGPLHIWNGMEWLPVECFGGILEYANESLFHTPSLELHSFCWFCLLPMCKLLFYLYIILYYYFLIIRDLFLNKKQKGSGLGGEEGEMEERKTIIRIYHVRKRSIFNKKKEKRKATTITKQNALGNCVLSKMIKPHFPRLVYVRNILDF